MYFFINVNYMNIVILHIPTIYNEPIITEELKPMIKELEKIGKVHNYWFKFTYYKNKFNLKDIEFENAAIDIHEKFKQYKKIFLVSINHACPYGLYFANKYPNMCQGIICYPFRYYCKESYERRLWKLKNNKGWSIWVKNYSMDTYLLKINNKRLQELLDKGGEEEANIVYLILDFYLQKNSNLIPKIFKNKTTLYTRLDLDINLIIKYNYNRKDIAQMKKIFNENDALQNSMIWNYDRIKFDAELKKNNVPTKLKIKYIISGWENYLDVVDEVKLFLLN
jgi:hypothetical protein